MTHDTGDGRLRARVDALNRGHDTHKGVERQGSDVLSFINAFVLRKRRNE